MSENTKQDANLCVETLWFNKPLLSALAGRSVAIEQFRKAASEEDRAAVNSVVGGIAATHDIDLRGTKFTVVRVPELADIFPRGWFVVGESTGNCVVGFARRMEAADAR